MAEYRMYQIVAQTIATDNFAPFNLPLTEDIEAFNRKAHLVYARLTIRTAATLWARLGYARNTGNTGTAADDEARTFVEGFLRGPPPTGGFTTAAANTVNEESLVWEGDVFLGSGISPPTGGVAPATTSSHFVRGLVWTKMGSTVTFSVGAVVRFDG
jgi:hypothetical protein